MEPRRLRKKRANVAEHLLAVLIEDKQMIRSLIGPTSVHDLKSGSHICRFARIHHRVLDSPENQRR
jgi:hypothetical protein